MSRWRQRGVGLVGLLVLVALVVGGSGVLALAAPISGAAYETVGGPGGGTVENPYGTAAVSYDDDGVPHVTASNERALAFAVGYVQARDRLFQMDLQRRIMNGTLAEIAGEAAVEGDAFHRRMGFRDAAAATWRQLQDTPHGEKLAAYSAGVNRFIDRGTLPLEFRLNDYEPRRWSPVATLLVGQQISWSLSGSFADLRRATIADRLPAATELYPRRLAHNATIIGTARGADSPPDSAASGGDARDLGALYEALAPHAGDGALGSNNWVVSGEHTASGRPLLANDPHLTLTAPPVWYEMRVQADVLDARGVTFPGIPFVIIGTNRNVSWGVTNVGADVTDVYTYEWRDGQYWYDGAWRTPETHTETVRVGDGETREVTVRRTVHGPLIERENRTVAVAWTGLTAQNQSLAIDRLTHASDIAEVERALRDFHVPAQNFVAAERTGDGTLYYPAGKYPIRRIDGEPVSGAQVFNGSAGHGEWRGFTPYGESNWSGFVPFEAIPHLRNPDAVATANQRVTDDAGFYMGTSMDFASPYRGQRIATLLDRAIAASEPVTRADFRSIQRDVRSLAAAGFVPQILDATDAMGPESRRLAESLAGWDYEMTPDSRAALVFALWRQHYMDATFADQFDPAGLGESYYPRYWTLQHLPRDSRWFDNRSTSATETRADVVARAMARTASQLEATGWSTYGDYNVADVDHPFPVTFLDYPERPSPGSPFTVRNYRVPDGGRAIGSSWRQIVGPDAAEGVLPGGNSGRYFSEHYADQFDDWLAGAYRSLPFTTPGDPTIRFEEAGS